MNRVLMAVVPACLAITCLACGEDSTPGLGESATASSNTSQAATETPSPSSVSAHVVVQFLNAPLTVARSHDATLQVKTVPNTSCAIEVDYKSGPSTAVGLGPKTSNASGSVSWTWKVGANTTPGVWPITVTCGDGSAQTSIKVT